ncbi:hypothetical protein [Zhongshania borealis]|uniref:Uncharacterized protein n=1 Tax=Zhongshania borealis TaxID=889488 RepID=A0ABP7W9S8_9GAMM
MFKKILARMIPLASENHNILTTEQASEGSTSLEASKMIVLPHKPDTYSSTAEKRRITIERLWSETQGLTNSRTKLSSLPEDEQEVFWEAVRLEARSAFVRNESIAVADTLNDDQIKHLFYKYEFEEHDLILFEIACESFITPSKTVVDDYLALPVLNISDAMYLIADLDPSVMASRGKDRVTSEINRYEEARSHFRVILKRLFNSNLDEMTEIAITDLAKGLQASKYASNKSYAISRIMDHIAKPFNPETEEFVIEQFRILVFEAFNQRISSTGIEKRKRALLKLLAAIYKLDDLSRERNLLARMVSDKINSSGYDNVNDKRIRGLMERLDEKYLNEGNPCEGLLEFYQGQGLENNHERLINMIVRVEELLKEDIPEVNLTSKNNESLFPMHR